MMEHPDTRVSDIGYQKTSAGREVEEKLRQLQDARRLGIHMVEYANAVFRMHTHTLEQMEKVPAEHIGQSFRKNFAHLHSLSLIPSSVSGISLRPFEVSDRPDNNYGYLVDLSSSSPHPARVVRAHHGTIMSEFSIQGKKLRLNQEQLPEGVKPMLEPLQAIYQRYHSRFEEDWEKNLLQAVGEDENHQLSDEQLDILGRAYEEGGALRNIQIDGGIAGFNEIVCAVHPQHIAAIVVPYCHKQRLFSSEMKESQLLLQAAMVGLQHCQNNRAWPVVFYHVDGEKRGQFSYVGQTRKELTKIALQALVTLGEEGVRSLCAATDEYVHAAIVESVLGCLNIDIECRGWQQEAKNYLDLMASASASVQSNAQLPGRGQ